MKFYLPKLDYKPTELAPTISEETFKYHCHAHHQGYLDKLNSLIEGTAFEWASLEEIIRTSTGPLFNNAAQAWNHSFYWLGLRPGGGPVPPSKFTEAIHRQYGGMNEFKDEFTKKANGLFGSGWIWITKSSDGELKIEVTKDAQNPIKSERVPLLAIDLWEHAYYIDYKNRRSDYIAAIWQIIDWNFVAKNFELAAAPDMTRLMIRLLPKKKGGLTKSGLHWFDDGDKNIYGNLKRFG